MLKMKKKNHTCNVNSLNHLFNYPLLLCQVYISLHTVFIVYATMFLSGHCKKIKTKVSVLPLQNLAYKFQSLSYSHTHACILITLMLPTRNLLACTS